MPQCFEHKTVSLLAKENKHTKKKKNQTKGRSHHRHRKLLDCATSCGMAILVRHACPKTADLSSISLPNKWKSPGSYHGKGDASQRLCQLLGEVSQPLALVCHWADLPLIRSLLLGGVTPAAWQQSPSNQTQLLPGHMVGQRVLLKDVCHTGPGARKQQAEVKRRGSR